MGDISTTATTEETTNLNNIPKNIEKEKYLKSIEIIKKNYEPMNDFFRNKYKDEAARNWDM